jgi:UDP-N-acetylmuramyl pentapeptide phosphotransferase/UDP-N-acetylglucosamine-1-phosphate transferase
LIAILVATTASLGADTRAGGLLILLSLATVVSLVSLLDDLRGLPPLARLFVHIAVAALAVAWLGPLDVGLSGVLPPVASRLMAQAITVVWIAGFINAFNFMDGTDGIAGTQALIAALAWTLAALWREDADLAVLAVAVSGAAAGFLLHNWPPASIFMGDVGSALLGFLLATLPMLAEPRASLLVAILPVWPFVFDTAFTLVRRARRGENLLAAHRSHLYQRLSGCGWPHGRIAVVYGGLSLGGAAVATAMAAGSLQSPIAAVMMLVAGPALLWIAVIAQESRQRQTAMSVSSARRSDHA